MTTTILRTLAALLAAALLAPAALNAEQRAPDAVVEALHASLLEAMQNADALGYGGRAALIGPVLDASFDFATIARIVNGRTWKELDEARRERFLEVFRDLSVATYATNFSGYDGERFETAGSEPSRGAMIVRTELVKTDGERIPLDYMLRENNGEWRIVNVVAQGVSDLSLKRAEYTAVIESEGFDSLVDKLRDKVSEMGPVR